MRKYQNNSFPHISPRFFFNKLGFIQAPAFFKGGAGFTLIELLVVIAVLGVLATGLMVLINPLGQMEKTRNQIRKNP